MTANKKKINVKIVLQEFSQNVLYLVLELLFLLDCFFSLLTLDSIIITSTRIASSSFTKSEIPILLKSRRKANRIIRGKETFFSERIEVKRPAIVSTLNGTL